MPCHIATCNIVDSVHLWTCTGPCHRRYHAACIGVQRNCEESIRRFMLPVCHDCQLSMNEQIDHTKMMTQQTQILEQLKLQNTAHEKLSSKVSKLSYIETLIEGIDTLSNQISIQKNELSSLIKAAMRPSPSADNLFDTLSSSMKEQYVSTFDAHKKKMAQTFEMLEEMISGHQNCLMSMVEEQHKNCFSNLEQELTPSLQSIALELNALRATVQNPSSNVDLIDELRSIHDAVAAKPVTPLLEPRTCLAEELNQQISQKIVSGWRLLGTRKVWKADWTEYDNRQLRRKKQQLKADRAKKRRQRKARNINNNNMNPHINSRYTHNMNYPLPPDRELLAAAKNLFSRPPASPSKRRSKRGIQFIRGETLNPPKDNVRGTPSPVPSPRRNRRPIITAPTVPPNLPTNSSPEVSPRRKRRPRITVPAVPSNLPTNHNGNMTPSVPPVSPQATFAYPFPNPYVTPFAAPCCHRAPTAPTAFDYPVMYGQYNFLPQRRVPM